MRIGDTLYHFDVNRRVYSKPPAGSDRIWGDIIYAEHFKALKIVGETRVSWLLEHNYKVKKDAIGTLFLTQEQMSDNIWSHHHRHKIRDLLDQANAAELRTIGGILGYQE